MQKNVSDVTSAVHAANNTNDSSVNPRPNFTQAGPHNAPDGSAITPEMAKANRQYDADQKAGLIDKNGAVTDKYRAMSRPR